MEELRRRVLHSRDSTSTMAGVPLPPVNFAAHLNGEEKVFPAYASGIVLLSDYPELLHIFRNGSTFQLGTARGQNFRPLVELQGNEKATQWDYRVTDNCVFITENGTETSYVITPSDLRECRNMTFESIKVPSPKIAWLYCYRNEKEQDFFELRDERSKLVRAGEVILKVKIPSDCLKHSLHVNEDWVVVTQSISAESSILSKKTAYTDVQLYKYGTDGALTLVKTFEKLLESDASKTSASSHVAMSRIIGKDHVVLVKNNRIAFVDCENVTVSEMECTNLNGTIKNVAARMKDGVATVYVSLNDEMGNLRIRKASTIVDWTVFLGEFERVQQDRSTMKEQIEVLRKTIGVLLQEKEVMQKLENVNLKTFAERM